MGFKLIPAIITSEPSSLNLKVRNVTALMNVRQALCLLNLLALSRLLR